MISINKLTGLPHKTRIRKIILILQAEEKKLKFGGEPEYAYLTSVFRLLQENNRLDQDIREYIDLELAKWNKAADLRRILNNVRNGLLRSLNAEPAEWDLLDPLSGELDGSARRIFPICVFLEDIRSPYNVGAIFRSAESFGVERIYISAGTPPPTHTRAQKTARGAVDLIPWQSTDLSLFEDMEGVFALEVGGTPVEEFPFPDSGVVLVGSEELGLSSEALHLAERKAGRVAILLAGAKRSLNVAVAFGILIQYWFSRLIRQEANILPGEK